MTWTTLIQPGALARLLEDDPGVVVCDCTFDLADHGAGRTTWGAGHIAGATHLGLEDVLSGQKTGRNGRHPLPDRDAFAARMAALGVSDGTQVLAYDAGSAIFAARLWFLLRWIGHDAVAVLDGGLAAWKAAGLPVVADRPVPRPPGTITVRPSLVPTLCYAGVREASSTDSRLIVDARAADRFRGENETLDPVGGHIPGARNRFFGSNLGPDGRFKPPAVLRNEFAAVLGDRLPGDVVLQCGSGVTACHNLLAMEVAGLPGAALYPGSWSEWSAQPDAPVARGDGAGDADGPAASAPGRGSDPGIQAFFDPATNTVSYLVWDPATRDACIIDPVLDWDNRSGEADTASADAMLRDAADRGLRVAWVLETHAHADHLTAAPYLKEKTGCRIGIGARITDVQAIFRPIFDASDVLPEGGDFDRLFEDGEVFRLGTLAVEVLHVPGHTPADVAYCMGSLVFVGDTLFMPDYGTARADFPGGDARQLFRSIQRLLALPPETRLFMCHDYKAPGRNDYRWESTVAKQRDNVHLAGSVTEDAFVAMRTARDATLATPMLLLPSIQVNIRGGRFPQQDAAGLTYLRIPVRRKGSAA